MMKETNKRQEGQLNESLPDILRERKEVLETIIREKQQALKQVPDGHLRISDRKSYAEYYWRTDPKDYNGRYLTRDQKEIAKKLAQKDYDLRIHEIAQKEISLVSDYLSYISDNSITGVYEDLSRARKELIHPIKIPDEEYIKDWLSEPYEPMGFSKDAPEYYSDSGIRVRSKSEIIIVNMLEKYEIPYRYEFQIQLHGKGTVRPDFICLNVRKRKEYIWEHFGMMDDEEYANKNILKISFYEENGYFPGANLITTFETSKIPINPANIKNMIRQYLL